MADLDFDPQTLHERYTQEREKRMRADGSDQYIELKSRFGYLNEAPYIE